MDLRIDERGSKCPVRSELDRTYGVDDARLTEQLGERDALSYKTGETFVCRAFISGERSRRDRRNAERRHAAVFSCRNSRRSILIARGERSCPDRRSAER